MKIIEIDGIQYSLTPIEENKPQTLYELCAEWVNDSHCPTVDNLIKKVEKWLPEEVESQPSSEWNEGYNNGYNSYRNTLLKKLK